ncbi:hypothetical protein ACFX11_000066 [Malus domestica]
MSCKRNRHYLNQNVRWDDTSFGERQTIEGKTELWHHRLGHISQKGLQELHKQGLLEGVSYCNLDFCEYCVLEKQRKVSFVTSSADSRSKEQLSYIHSDV